MGTGPGVLLHSRARLFPSGFVLPLLAMGWSDVGGVVFNAPAGPRKTLALGGRGKGAGSPRARVFSGEFRVTRCGGRFLRSALACPTGRR
jgi:hypothetical protein